MHTYSTNESRVRVYGVLAVAAVAIAWLIVWVTSGLDWPEWLVSAPSLAAVFTALYQLFDKVLWRLPLTRRLGLVDVVDVSGDYKGKLISTFKGPDDKPVTRAATFCIRQTWTQIEITMSVAAKSSTSRSQSAVASLGRRSDSTHLVYVYHNQVNPGVAEEDMGDHEGAANLEISSDGVISGRYFNSRPRAGTIMATRQSTS